MRPCSSGARRPCGRCCTTFETNCGSSTANAIKGVSSRYLRAESTQRINRSTLGADFWSRSCFAGSCGGAPISIVRQYIEGQKRPV